jgi:hypothetical protein
LSVSTRSTTIPRSAKNVWARSQKPGGGAGLFVAEDLAVGDPAVGIDGGVHERVADHRLGVVLHAMATMSSPAAAFGDAADLLDVDMDTLAGPGHLHTPDRRSRHAVEVVETVESVTHEHRVHCRSWHRDDAGDASRAQAALASQMHDSPLPRRLRARRRVTRAAGTILEPGPALGLVATPLPHSLGGSSHRWTPVSKVHGHYS